MRHDDSCGGSSVLLAFILGGIAGAALAMLYSPMSGDEARRKLADLKDDLSDKTEDLRDDAGAQLKDAVQKGKDFIEDQKDVISSAINAGKGAYKKEKEKLAKEDA